MSLRVLVVCEDFRNDKFIVMPIVQRILDNLHKRKVTAAHGSAVLLEHKSYTTVDKLSRRDTLAEILQDNSQYQGYVVILDRDCNRKTIEDKVRNRQNDSPRFVIGLAHQEVEVWALALHYARLQKKPNTPWKDVRSHCDPKEAFFVPLIESKHPLSPGRGRREAMAELNRHWPGLLKKCPEIADLERAMEACLRPRPG